MLKKTHPMINYWLVIGSGLFVIAMILLLLTDDEKRSVHQIDEHPVAEYIQDEKVTATKELGSLQETVRPLQLTKRMVAVNRYHHPAFRGTGFVKKHADKWVVELFRATEEAVILNYLRLHADIQGLTYLRLSGEEQEETYVLLYGLENSQQNATQLAENLESLDLPASLKPNVQSLKYYHKWVRDAGAEEGDPNTYQVNQITLKPVARPAPVPVEPVIAKPKPVTTPEPEASAKPTAPVEPQKENNDEN